jgi:hypothetical protein
MRLNLLRAAALLHFPAAPVVALLAVESAVGAPRDIPAGPMLWSGPHLKQEAGVAWFVGAQQVLCTSCSPCAFTDFALMLPDPGPVGSIPGCSVTPAGTSIVIRRLEPIHLPAVGSTASVSVELLPIHFDNAGFALECNENRDPIEITSLASSGQMTIRRTGESRGSFELHFPLSLDVVFDSWGFLRATLGPYTVEAKDIPWSFGGAPEPPGCTPCTQDFRVGGGILHGSGTSPPSGLDDAFHLDQSEFILMFAPVCGDVAGPGAVSATAWWAIKDLYRSR